MASREICRGLWGSVVLVVLAEQSCPAADFIGGLDVRDKAKLLALFQRYADHGYITNRERFKKIADNVYEFKSFQIRVFCFIKGRQAVVTHGAKKKRDDLNPADIERALRIRSQYEASLETATRLGKAGKKNEDFSGTFRCRPETSQAGRTHSRCDRAPLDDYGRKQYFQS